MTGRFHGGALALAFLVGCGSGPTDPHFAPGTNTMALSRDGGTAFIADADNGAVVAVDVATGRLSQAEVGLEPTRLVRVGDKVYVTLRAERAIGVVGLDANGAPELLDVVPIGAEPYGIIASPDGAHLYVTLSTEGAVVEARTDTLEETRRWRVPNDPRWMAITPEGKQLYVASAMGGALWRIDLRGAGEPQRVRLPTAERGIADDGTLVELTPRLTGDPAIDPEGGLLAIPVLYVDNTTSAGAADPLAAGDDPSIGDGPVNSSGGYAGGVIEGMTRFNPAVVVIPLDAGGVALDGQAVASLVNGSSAIHGGVPQPELPEPSDELFSGEVDFAESVSEPMPGVVGEGSLIPVRAYITSLAFSPSGNTIAATIEAGRSVAFVAARAVDSGRPQRASFRDDPFGDGAFEPTPRVMVGTDDGPRGVVYVDADTAVTWSAFGRSVSVLDAANAERGVGLQAMGQLFGGVTWSAGIDTHLQPSILPPEVQEGRRLFFSATDASMATAGAGVSCSTCHFEGRNDGLTWTFDHGVRQTPSLAGKVSATAPVTWTNDVPSVAQEAEITSQGRMGGQAIGHGALHDIAAFIDFTRDVDVPLRGAQDPAIARGKAVFERQDVGCATCHAGERYTDNRSYTMFGLVGVNTPGLVGIAASGPYLHDGSAATLRDVLLRADAGNMGRTAHLTPGELADLETYLMSL